MEADQLKALGLAVVQTEMSAIAALTARIDDSFVEACRLMLACTGRVIVTGMGKSGHIGSKVAATLASTGTPAFFVHPGEASHGDLGMITAKDTVLALSNSGETEEILVILPIIKRLGIPLISLTGSPTSSLARGATVHIDVSVEQEACPLGLAPTASTTACLVMGDALAVALLEGRGFTADDFARSHPGGRLGRRLLLLISDVMVTGEAIPAVMGDATLSAGLLEMSKKGLGMTAVLDEHRRVIGIFTDGDLRRKLDQGIDVHQAMMTEVMTPDFQTIQSAILAAEALQVMESHKINGLLVVNAQGELEGAVNMHHLLKAGVV